MQTMIESVGVLYCEGWDPRIGAVVGPLTPAQARHRDLTGDQYAVLLLAGAVPRALMEVSWRYHACTVWGFDEQQRRATRYDLRRLTRDELVLIEEIHWRYPRDWELDFDHTTGRRTRRYSLDGRFRETHEPGGDLGDSLHGLGLTSAGPPRCPVPAFGEWGTLAGFPGTTPPDAAFTEHDEVPAGVPVSPLVSPPWQPPVPLQPAGLEQVFGAGSRYTLPRCGAVTVEVREVGRLRMPTGRLAVADPGVLHDGVPPGLLSDSVPFTATVPPGTYPVSLSLVRAVAHPDRHVTVAAARLEIRREPVVAWEMALRPGDDPRTLGAGEFYGFGVDTGRACFVDAAAVAGAARAADQHRDLLKRVGGDRTAELTDPDSGANLIAFSTGLGVGEYPTWIGRTAGGEVACFVADMLVLDPDDQY